VSAQAAQEQLQVLLQVLNVSLSLKSLIFLSLFNKQDIPKAICYHPVWHCMYSKDWDNAWTMPQSKPPGVEMLILRYKSVTTQTKENDISSNDQINVGAMTSAQAEFNSSIENKEHEIDLNVSVVVERSSLSEMTRSISSMSIKSIEEEDLDEAHALKSTPLSNVHSENESVFEHEEYSLTESKRKRESSGDVAITPKKTEPKKYKMNTIDEQEEQLNGI